MGRAVILEIVSSYKIEGNLSFSSSLLISDYGMGSPIFLILFFFKNLVARSNSTQTMPTSRSGPGAHQTPLTNRHVAPLQQQVESNLRIAQRDLSRFEAVATEQPPST